MSVFSFIYFHFCTLTAQGQKNHVFHSSAPSQGTELRFVRSSAERWDSPTGTCLQLPDIQEKHPIWGVCAKLAPNGHSVAVLINHTRAARFTFSCNRRSPVPFRSLAAFFSLGDSSCEDRAVGVMKRCPHRSAPACRSSPLSLCRCGRTHRTCCCAVGV